MPADRHIALVTPGFPRDEADTSCIPPLQIALRRLRRGHPDIRITVVALHYPDNRRPYTWHEMEVLPVGAANRPLPLRLPALARASRIVSRRHREDPIDMIHALWLGDTTMLGWWIGRRLGLPVVATVMGQDARPTNRWLKLLPLDGVRLTAVSQRSADELMHSRGLPAEVIPWGLDLDPGNPPAWNDRPIDLLGVGSLTENKDFAVLVRAAAELQKMGRECRTVLIGDGLQRRRLEGLVRELGLGGIFFLEGQQSREQVLESMRRSKILVHPSRYESFGFVFSEALANGMAVVSRPVGAARACDRWKLCEASDGFSSAIEETLNHPPGTKAVTIHSEDETADALAALYRSVGTPR